MRERQRHVIGVADIAKSLAVKGAHGAAVTELIKHRQDISDCLTGVTDIAQEVHHTDIPWWAGQRLFHANEDAVVIHTSSKNSMERAQRASHILR